MEKISFIANTGIQFFTTEARFNPSEAAIVNDVPVRPLIFTEVPLSPERNKIEVVLRVDGGLYRLTDLRDENCIRTSIDLSGVEDDVLDDSGVPQVAKERLNQNLLDELDAQNCYSESNIEGSFPVQREGDDESLNPFQCILGQWIPVPLFYHFSAESNKSRCSYPAAWCRVKITRLSEDRYQFVWAYDTHALHASKEEDDCRMLPYFSSDTVKKEVFGLPTRVSHLMAFLDDNEWVGSYMSSLIFGPNVQPVVRARGRNFLCRHLGYYVNLMTQLRVLDVCPQVILYNDRYKGSDDVLAPIPVDLVLDVGNSKTCGVLFEDGDFTKASLLAMRDLSDPSKVYASSFDMRVVFSRTEFGRHNMDMDEDVFKWNSFLRVGEEARRLMSMSKAPTGEAMKMTHYSSPKRYLWDDQPFAGQWEFVQLDNSEATIQENAVYVDGMSIQFNVDGTLRTDEDFSMKTSFSRRSLMTCVMIEIIQQAMCQINSYDYLNIETGRGKVDQPRVLNNIIITCPTAMPLEEQRTLRRCASDAFIAIARSKDPMLLYSPYDPKDWEDKISVVPSVRDLSITDFTQFENKVEWGYDEATCCQLVYLYSEIVSKYHGNCAEFIEHKGSVRNSLKAEGYEKKALTIGSVDIGAGTTDVMICSYKYDQVGTTAVLTPVPQFWDSFYTAGDDLLREIVYGMVLKEPDRETFRKGYGSIFNAACADILEKEYADKLTPQNRHIIEEKAVAKLNRSFGSDSYAVSYLDKIMRNDFNVQVSVPIAQKMLDMMKNAELATDLSYEEIFGKVKPSKSVLDFFEQRFGFRLETLMWSYSPDRVSQIIRSVFESMLKRISIILSTYRCDVVLLAGRPTSLSAVTDLFLKFFPVSPDRHIRLLPKNENVVNDESRWNCYKVGRWFPTADDNGYFKDLKPVVAVGAMVGYLASHNKLSHFQLNTEELRKRMQSTANYIGSYEENNCRIPTSEVKLTPQQNSATFKAPELPYFLGCKQINTEFYHARPLYSLSVKPGADVSMYDMSLVTFTVTRRYKEDKELLTLQSARDRSNQDITDLLQLKIQSLVERGTRNDKTDISETRGYWLDNGVFNFN